MHYNLVSWIDLLFYLVKIVILLTSMGWHCEVLSSVFKALGWSFKEF